MKSRSEVRMMTELRRRAATGEQASVLEMVNELGINTKRAAYICEKWSVQGLYGYGCSVLAGWLTKKAVDMNLEEWSGR
jgi:hypothetical protein